MFSTALSVHLYNVCHIMHNSRGRILRCMPIYMSTFCIFTPLLPWTVVYFFTNCQRFVNGSNINGENEHSIIEINEICWYCCRGIIDFLLILRGYSTAWYYPLTQICKKLSCSKWKFQELPTTSAQLESHSDIFFYSPAIILKGLHPQYYSVFFWSTDLFGWWNVS